MNRSLQDYPASGATRAEPDEIQIASCTGAGATVDAVGDEPCPAPLAWQEVLTAFRTEAEPWELRCGGRLIRGRTWGEGPPLYLLPGLGGTHELYALLVWLLRDDFRCVVYDDFEERPAQRELRPPTGSHPSGSDPTGGRRQLSPEQLVDHLLAAADRHGDERFRLYAPAFAGVTALSAMLAKPDRVLAAAVQGGFAHRRLSLAERCLIQLGRRLRCNFSAVTFRQALQRQNHLPWFPPIDRGRWSFFVENTGRVPVAALAARAAVLRSFDVREMLGDISQPVLLVRTEGEGRLAAGCQELLAQRLPHAQVEQMHSSGQLPYLTHPHRLAKLLRAFFVDENDG